MRKVILLFALMTTVLLSGCADGGAQQALDTALTIRSTFLNDPQCAFRASLSADYGQRVYDFELDVTRNAEETVLTVISPELVAGITARLREETGFLEYDGLCLETGPLTSDGMSPLSAVPAMFDAIRGAYILTCGYTQDGLLRVDYGDPEQPADSGTQFSIWFDPTTFNPTRGEVTCDGFRCVTCTFSLFTKELTLHAGT